MTVTYSPGTVFIQSAGEAFIACVLLGSKPDGTTSLAYMVNKKFTIFPGRIVNFAEMPFNIPPDSASWYPGSDAFSQFPAGLQNSRQFNSASQERAREYAMHSKTTGPLTECIKLPNMRSDIDFMRAYLTEDNHILGFNTELMKWTEVADCSELMDEFYTLQVGVFEVAKANRS